MEFGKKALKGISVNIYQGANGTWYGDVLLSRQRFPAEDTGPWYVSEPVGLPKRGNRPRVDQSSDRWWYDISAGQTVYRKHHPNGPKGVKRSTDEALRALVCEVAALVSEILPDKDETKILAAVSAVPAKSHGDWR